MANTYLTRSKSSPTSDKKGTISFWIKRTNLTNQQATFVSGGGSIDSNIFFENDGTLQVYDYQSGAYQFRYVTNRVFRDSSAWYHIVVRIDTTDSTAGDRVKIYVNGVQETSFSVETDPSQNLTPLFFTNAYAFWIGAYRGSSGYTDGLYTHFHYTDGYAYDASTFGESDSVSGIWKPKTAPSVTYGTNGFFLKFENSGAMGTDSSGNSNNFTVSGTLTQNVDTPSNNFATFSTIYQPKDSGNAGMSNGNLTHGGSGGDYSGCAGLGMKTGKYYWEVKFSAGSSTRNIGIVRADKIHSNTTYGFYLAQGGAGSLTTEYSAGYRGGDGDFVVKSTGSQTLTSASTTIAIGDIVGVAVDCDNYTIQFFKNGVSMQTLNLTSAFFDVEQLPADRTDDGTYFQYNFGQGYFGTTQVASAGTAPSEGGIFEYDCPSGYQALCTKGINSF